MIVWLWGRWRFGMRVVEVDLVVVVVVLLGCWGR